jgi:hypothetical protein
MSFIKDLDRFIDYVKTAKPSINRATVDVTERYARQKLKMKKADPLIYKGLTLSCRGSKRWRYENQSMG